MGTVQLDDDRAGEPVGTGPVPSPEQDGAGEALRAIHFVHPVPGFPGLRDFALVDLDGDAAEAAPAGVNAAGVNGAGAGPAAGPPAPVLYELRSVERPEVRFMVATAYAFFPDYDLELDDQTCDNLGLVDAADALVLVILTLGPDIASTTANLLAPVIVNSRTRSAAQVILSGSEWPVRAALG